MTKPPPVDPLDDADFADEDDELIAPAPRAPASVEPIRVVLREQEGAPPSAWVGDRRHWTEIPPASND